MQRVGGKFTSTTGAAGPVRLQTVIPDDDSLASGEYIVQLIAVDAAGLRSTTTVFEDGSPSRIRFPLRPRSRLTVGVAPMRKGAPLRVRLFDLGDGARLAGVLAGASGAPLAGASLTVVEHTEDDAVHALGTVTTGVDGGFTMRLGRSVSRELIVRYRGDAQNGPAEARARQNVRAGVTLHARRAGPGVLLHGRVDRLTASIPENGVPVIIELCPLRRCTPFGSTAQSDSEGRFERYWPLRRFRRAASLHVRARVNRMSGWPFADGVSKIVAVRIGRLR